MDIPGKILNVGGQVVKLALILVWLAAAAVLVQAAAIHLIHLNPQPTISRGCPANVRFDGHIEADGPLDVTYQWLRIDGASTDHALHFNRAGSRPISTVWTLSGNYSGWMQLVIVSPKRMQTAKAQFSVHCGR